MGMLPQDDTYHKRLSDKMEELVIAYHEGIVNGKTFEELYSVVQSIRAIQEELERVKENNKTG